MTTFLVVADHRDSPGHQWTRAAVRCCRAYVIALASLLVWAPVRGQPHARERPARVVLVVIDTLRLDRFDALIEAGRLPYLAALAAASARFSGARASSSWTPTSTASLWTGLHPIQHGVLRGRLSLRGQRSTPYHRLPDARVTLPELLARAGYVGVGVADNPHIDRAAGFARGFDRFATLADRGARQVERTALRLLRSAARGPTPPSPERFVYLHFMDPHAPYRKRRPHYREPDTRTENGRALSAYDSEVVHVDAALGRLHKALGWARDTLIIVTSDHGEAFGEHGLSGHPNHLYDELLRVPLLFFWPGQIQPAERPEATAVLDVLPTLRGLLGLPPDPLDRGENHASALLQGRPVTSERWLYAARDGQLGRDPQRRRSLIGGGHKLIWSSRPDRRQCYALDDDPAEQRDLCARVRAPAPFGGFDAARADIERERPRFQAELRSPTDPSPGLLRRLSALGYVQ